jgi:type I restriction enzyme, R subunit
MTINEKEVEELAIKLLKEQGYEAINAHDLADLRSNPSEVILEQKLKSAIRRINNNPDILPENIDDAIRKVKNINSSDVISRNEYFHKMLISIVNVPIRKNGGEQGACIKLVDFDNIENNEFTVVNQFSVIENNQRKRLDIVLFINGIPIVVMELKNPISENVSLHNAYKQIQGYKRDIPSLFTYNQILVIADGLDVKVGSISSEYQRFIAWKSDGGKKEESRSSKLKVLIECMLNKATLIDIIKNFIVFQESTKKLASYHQYYAVNKALESVLKASSSQGDRKGGVVWHTQGSGKSLSMLFLAGKLVSTTSLKNPVILIVTDRNDLDDQLFGTFASAVQLLRQEPEQAQDKNSLKELLETSGGEVVFTTIQKFSEDCDKNKCLSNRSNIVVIVDEAHRTQYSLVDGFAGNMRNALPNATYIGFTGTPIEKNDKNTREVFGDYVDTYDIYRAKNDGVTVDIFYQSRFANISIDENTRKLINDLDDKFINGELEDNQENIQIKKLINNERVIDAISENIVQHFEMRKSYIDGKAMIVAISRKVAVRFYNAIIKLKPEWHSDDINKGVIKIVMTSAQNDNEEMEKHNTDQKERSILARRMKNPNDELKLVIVVDMWLTGFDVPSMHTLYFVKKMKDHNLMQAIARVNRRYGDKTGGLIVDYLGIFSNLKKTLSFYSANGGKGRPLIPMEEAVEEMLEKIKVISEMLSGVSYKEYFTADAESKLSIIGDIQEYILGLNYKKRFIDEVKELSRWFTVAHTHEEAINARDEVGFFYTIKHHLVKSSNTTGLDENYQETEDAISKALDKALIVDGFRDIDILGINKLSILSEEFWVAINSNKHKNIALERAESLLKYEIKERKKKSLAQSRTLINRLNECMQKYDDEIISNEEAIEEMRRLTKDIQNIDEKQKELGISDHEYAFYTAIDYLTDKNKQKEAAIKITSEIKEKTTIDWMIKKSAESTIKITVKDALREFGYPEDKTEVAIGNVWNQLELLENEIKR